MWMLPLAATSENGATEPSAFLHSASVMSRLQS